MDYHTVLAHTHNHSGVKVLALDYMQTYCTIRTATPSIITSTTKNLNFNPPCHYIIKHRLARVIETYQNYKREFGRNIQFSSNNKDGGEESQFLQV